MSSFAAADPGSRVYWAEPGRVLAGDYPGEYDVVESRRRLDGLIDAGVRTIINLLEPHEEGAEGGVAAYQRLLDECARRSRVSVQTLRFSVHDMSVPRLEEMASIQSAIDASLAREHPVYVHCWRGRGRTGTVVAIYLIRRGLANVEDFVDVIARLREGTDHGGPSPETRAQVEFVRSYPF